MKATTKTFKYFSWSNIKRLLQGDLTENELIVVLLAPAVLFLLGMVVYPLVRVIHLSFHNVRLSMPWLGTPFVGVKNYIKMFTDPRFYHSLKVLGLYGSGSVFFPAILGLGMALIVNRTFPGRWLARAAVILPWAMPRALTALAWSWIFDTSYGVLNGGLMRLGIIQESISWLGNGQLAMFSLIFTSTWKTSSFVALILLAGLQSIPKQLYEAGTVDGATGFQAFRYITLPQLKSSFLIALIFRTIVAIQVFDTPYALTTGGPGTATEPLSLYIYRVTLNHLNFGYGSALALFMITMTLMITVFYITILGERG
ncbi:sugar ABC transporter permease [Candidatus Bipolaricaulota bacterium]|nr:sugar ABC transporter permease [Candidatus Bipolaricaulota bacterium]MBS3825965.1 sugar ABC transporter permease [Candidatus Bipolaricaulota bacterium]